MKHRDLQRRWFEAFEDCAQLIEDTDPALRTWETEEELDRRKTRLLQAHDQLMASFDEQDRRTDRWIRLVWVALACVGVWVAWDAASEAIAVGASVAGALWAALVSLAWGVLGGVIGWTLSRLLIRRWRRQAMGDTGGDK